MKFKYFYISIFFIVLLAPSWLSAQTIKKSVRWEEVPYSGGYIVEVQDSLGRIIVQSGVVRPPYNFIIRTGLYSLRITTLDRWGGLENRSTWFPFEVRRNELNEEEGENELGKLDLPLYAEVYLYDLPTTSFYSLTTPQFWQPLKLRFGYKNFLSKGLNVGIQSEIFSLAYKMELPYGFGSYNIRGPGLHSFDIFFRARLANNIYFVPHIYPIAMFIRTVALIKNENGVDYISPLGYLSDQNYVQFITARFITEDIDILYLRTINLFFGGSLSLQYFSEKNSITASASFNMWGSYGGLSGGNFDLIVYYGFEAAIGVRL